MDSLSVELLGKPCKIWKVILTIASFEQVYFEDRVYIYIYKTCKTKSGTQEVLNKCHLLLVLLLLHFMLWTGGTGNSEFEKGTAEITDESWFSRVPMHFTPE